MHKRTFDRERRASARRGWANAHPQTRALLVGRPPTVCGGAVAFAFIRATGGLRPPLLCCSANVCRRNNDFCDAPTYIRPRAAGVSPPWLLGKRTCRNFAVKSRETAGTMPTNAGAVAFVRHGWLTPAAPGCTTFVRCEMRYSQCGVAHPTKSGGRQPAVAVREAYLQERCRKVAGDCRHYAHERWCGRVRLPRLAYASRSWLHDVRSLRNA
jgi:hypothetical protein